MNDFSATDWSLMSDSALIATIGNFVKKQRINQNRTQHDIAKDAGISRSTLSLLERGEKISLSSLIRVLRILDLLYVMDAFFISDEISPVEYAKLKKKEKKRVRKKKNMQTREDSKW